MIEAGADPLIVRPAITEYVGNLMSHLNGDSLEAVILGCTHYPFVAHHIQAALGPGVQLIDTAPAPTPAVLAARLARQLDLLELCARLRPLPRRR